jgi:hypothetical protein
MAWARWTSPSPHSTAASAAHAQSDADTTIAAIDAYLNMPVAMAGIITARGKWVRSSIIDC